MMPHNQQRKEIRKARRQAGRAIRRDELRAILAEEPAPVMGSIDLTAPVVIAQGIEAADGQAKKLPTIQVDAYNGGPMRVGGYYRPVVIDLAGVAGLGRPIPVLRNHDAERIVGHGVAAVDGGAIKLAGTLSAENEDSNDITRLAGNGFPWQASVGLQPMRLENVEPGATSRVNGQDIAGPAIVVRAGKLFEVSIVPLGADDTTATRVAATLEGAGTMNFEAWLVDNGWNAETLSAGQLKCLRAAYDGTSGNNGAGMGSGGAAGGASTAGSAVRAAPVTAQTVLAQRIAQEQREEAYAQIIANAMRDGLPTAEAELMVNAATEAQTNVTQFELDVMRALRKLQAPTVQVRNPRNDLSQEVIECALAQTGNATEYERLNADGTRTNVQLYSAEMQQRARDRFPTGLTLMEAMVMSARRSGYAQDTFRLTKPLMRAAFTQVMARGASTYDLSGVLSNVANKSIVAGFNSVETSWREVSAISTVTDFKEITHYALTGDFIYEQVGKGGELRNATMGEQAYGNKANTYGKIFAITREDFINDDLSAFSRVRTMLGRGAALRLNLVFWTEFLASVTTFFAAGRNNYMEGANTVLDIDSLSAAELLFMNQTDPDGNPLGLEPSILLTPNALATKAVQLARDTEIRIDGSSSKTTYTTGNPHAGKFRPVRSSYLNNANVPNGSATHWFLTANPQDLPLIETVFLNGQQMPIVEAADADFDMLGVQMRGYHDFGVRKQEYRAGVRSKGAV
jgi:phage major head subunit gpT-like protein